MAQAAARLEVPQIQVPQIPERSLSERGSRKWHCRLKDRLSAAVERDRQRRELSGFGANQDLGRETGIRG